MIGHRGDSSGGNKAGVGNIEASRISRTVFPGRAVESGSRRLQTRVLTGEFVSGGRGALPGISRPERSIQSVCILNSRGYFFASGAGAGAGSGRSEL